jgi:DNA-binding transcriptional LysR family regulator
VLPRWVVRADVRAQKLVAIPLGRAGLKRSWAIAYVQSRQLPPYSQTFIRICRERFSTLMEADGVEGINSESSPVATGKP